VAQCVWCAESQVPESFQHAYGRDPLSVDIHCTDPQTHVHAGAVLYHRPGVAANATSNYFSVEVTRVSFIPPAIPKLRASPPSGDEWMHEVKFIDGYRVQLHKTDTVATIFSNYAERAIMWSAPPLDLRPALFSTV
jgi:ATP-dependent DNA ligase